MGKQKEKEYVYLVFGKIVGEVRKIYKNEEDAIKHALKDRDSVVIKREVW